jgi:hypothetical protein
MLLNIYVTCFHVGQIVEGPFTVVIRLSPHFFKSASRISPHSVGLKMRINIYGSVYCDRVNPKSKIVICLLPSIFSHEIFETACWMVFFTATQLHFTKLPHTHLCCSSPGPDRPIFFLTDFLTILFLPSSPLVLL